VDEAHDAFLVMVEIGNGFLRPALDRILKVVGVGGHQFPLAYLALGT